MLWRRHHYAGGSVSPTQAVPEKTDSNNRPFLCRTPYLVKRTNYVAPHYAVFSNLLSLLLLWFKYSPQHLVLKHSNYVLPLSYKTIPNVRHRIRNYTGMILEGIPQFIRPNCFRLLRTSVPWEGFQNKSLKHSTCLYSSCCPIRQLLLLPAGYVSQS